MKTLQIGVKILIINPDNQEFIAIERNPAEYKLSVKESYDIPGGRINLGEDPLEGLRREVYEETGLTIKSDPFICDAGTIANTEEKQIVRLTYFLHEKIDLEEIVLGKEHLNSTYKKLEESPDFHPLLNRAIRMYYKIKQLSYANSNL